MENFYIKTNRTFTFIRKSAWIITPLVAIGGIWVPKLGLLVIPIMISLLIMAFLKGRYWCGNFCPHGSLYDFITIKFSLNKRLPSFLKSKVLVIGFFGLFGYKLISKFIKVAGIYGTLKFWDRLGLIFVSSYLMVLIVGGLLSIIAPRAWCQFCPMGTLQILSYKLGKLLGVTKNTDRKITVARKELCHNCGKCSRVCPMQLTPYLEFSDKNQFEHEKCIRCSTCVYNCPAGILTLNKEEKALTIKEKVSISGYEKRRRLAAYISNIRKLKEDVMEYTFTVEYPEVVDYRAGQFILVKILDKPSMSRAYSVSSYNEHERTLSVTIKYMVNGFGTNLIYENFKLGDKVELEGPMGRELIVDKKAKKVLLVAGGIGITPFLPIVKDLMRSKNDIEEVTLIYGVNYEKEFIYDEELKQLELEFGKFKYIKTVAFDKNWEGRKGFVTNVIEEMELNDYKVYMCGPKPMVLATLKVLDKLKVDEKKIFVESA